MERQSVVPHNSKEVIAVFTDEDGDARNVTVKDMALAAEYTGLALTNNRLAAVAQAEIEAADAEFQEKAKALTEKFQADAKVIDDARLARIQAAQEQLAGQQAELEKQRAAIDARTFAKAEQQLAKEQAAQAQS